MPREGRLADPRHPLYLYSLSSIRLNTSSLTGLAGYDVTRASNARDGAGCASGMPGLNSAISSLIALY